MTVIKQDDLIQSVADALRDAQAAAERIQQ